MNQKKIASVFYNKSKHKFQIIFDKNATIDLKMDFFYDVADTVTKKGVKKYL
jgi:hypothetical protein